MGTHVCSRTRAATRPLLLSSWHDCALPATFSAVLKPGSWRFHRSSCRPLHRSVCRQLVGFLMTQGFGRGIPLLVSAFHSINVAVARPASWQLDAMPKALSTGKNGPGLFCSIAGLCAPFSCSFAEGLRHCVHRRSNGARPARRDIPAVLQLKKCYWIFW